MVLRWILFSAAAAWAGSLLAQGTIEEVPPDWRAADRERLEIAAAEASATLSGPYAPNRLHDGDRRTKWVCPIRPSAASPQWIALRLAGGEAEIDAVAVFGERIGNDGILDADLQVFMEGAFKTAASIRAARSASWLARFEPVRGSQVRLQVLRSSGPSDHTDVFEVEVFGRPLSSAEQKALLAERLAKLGAEAAAAEKALQDLAAGRQGPPPAFQRALEKLKAGAAGRESALSRWEGLDPKARSAALGEADRALALARRLNERCRRAGSAGAARRAALAASDAGQTAVSSERLAVSLNPQRGDWSASWAEGVEVAISGARFSAEVGGQKIDGASTASSARPFTDALGKGKELLLAWQAGGVRVECELRIYDRSGALTLGGRISNQGEQEIKLGTTLLLEVGEGGWWRLGSPWEAPAAVYLEHRSQLRSSPFCASDFLEAPPERSYASSGVLALAGREPAAALLLGCVRAEEASPDLSARFRLDEGGAGLSASCRFLGRILGPGEIVELNRLYLAAGKDPFALLEAYGDAMARFSARPPRSGPTSLWCSWYAHRMAMTEEKVLANAEVAARHLKPLGFEIIQLDHGWQKGDVTGDWVPNERFPHGLQWLANQLRERHGLRLGVWISPTDVAATSDLFKRHPEWMLKGEDGQPRVNWRWYWKPNPDCYELDATHPEAYKYIAGAFRQLTDWGVSYYKIDFIAAAGGEHFVQHDRKATRGWSVLKRAMEAVRAGAGEAAWIRYCQTPPLLSTGLADSAYGGGDTLDAGVPGRFDVLRSNAHHLAAGYWLNDRAYHREVCDMSVRMQGSIEEARVRAAIMTLAGCSIAWSDELCYLPPSRIRLMQQCMPPGNPPMRPLDLFEREVPSIWHIPVKAEFGSWDVIGLFNFNPAAEPRSVRFEQLGLDPQAEYAVFEFWEERFLGIQKGVIELVLPPESSRVLSIRKLTGAPQLLGTDMHLLQGFHEVKKLAWVAEKGALSGLYRRAPGLQGKAFFLVPEGYSPRFDFPLSPESAKLTHLEGQVWMQEVEFTGSDHEWTIPFDASEKGKNPLKG